MFPHFLPLFDSLASKCLLVLLCMFGHELGHILVARYFNVPVKKIGFSWMGMYIQRARALGWPEIFVCMAGPAMNLTLAVLFWNISNWFALCNLVFGLVNILPISHSDGSHAWDAVRAMNQPVTVIKKNSSHAIV